MALTSPGIRGVLLKRQGLVFLEPRGEGVAERVLLALEVELADLGYALSARLRGRLRGVSPAELAEIRGWLWAVLGEETGAKRKHTPLFRSFPDGIPADTQELWMRRVLVHFLQEREQPCLSCLRVGTTHVLSPCLHVVCDRCFDGRNYSACPICGHKVDRPSPFFQPASVRGAAKESVQLKLLDLGAACDEEARRYFVRLCERKQALSPTDRADLLSMVQEAGAPVLGWLPAAIPVRENVALVFGTLLQGCPPGAVLPAAKAHIKTATDILRLLAAYSGVDPSLQAQTSYRSILRIERPARWWGKIAQALGARAPSAHLQPVYAAVKLKRFKVAKLSRPLRRELLAFLESLDAERLVEDMLRHRSYWVWMGEFLHPHEYARRYPKVARAFTVLRKKAPDGTRAPRFRGFYARMEAAAARGDSTALLDVLAERPGELARRFDHALRVAGADDSAAARVLERFTASITAFSTPVLLTLRAHLPSRLQPAPVRIYWPKGGVTKGVSSPDQRQPLAPSVVERALGAIEQELLRRFAAKAPLGTCIVDTALKDVVAPFNERTASPAAVALPRGSRIAVPRSKTARMFIHWCEPEKKGVRTDVDLSVGFYDAAWNHTGVCAYYQLKLSGADGREIAVSSGDFTSAPYPDGASEFIDLHRERALAAGMRYAVMVVNAYSGMPFSLLERAFAGLMLRDDVQGKHFDPRTVELKFALQGANGIFLPLVFDLEASTLHWLDVYSRGELALNNVASSNAAITKICPEMIAYFGSGVRSSMFDLALLHGAARARCVVLRGKENVAFERSPEETPQAFLLRIQQGKGVRTAHVAPRQEPVLAALYRGDLELPSGSLVYALFRGKSAPNLAASDLIS